MSKCPEVRASRCCAMDPGVKAALVKAFVWISIGFSLIAVVSHIMQMAMFASGSYSQADIVANDHRQNTVVWMERGVIAAWLLFSLLWIYRANANCHKFGAGDMRFSPEWAIGYYFVPIQCFYKPYQAMQEIWRVSESPAGWKQQYPSRLVRWWWGLWLAEGFLMAVSVSMSHRAETVFTLQVWTLGTVMATALRVGSMTVWLAVVSAVTGRQQWLIQQPIPPSEAQLVLDEPQQNVHEVQSFWKGVLVVAIPMGAAATYVFASRSGWLSGAYIGTLIGLALGFTRMAMQKDKQETNPFPDGTFEGERVCHYGLAFRIKPYHVGQFVLTPTRIVFKPKVEDPRRRRVDIVLATVAGVEVLTTGRGLAIALKDGTQETFMAGKEKLWCQKITEALAAQTPRG